MREDRKRPVGGGRYCYSGPNCRIHGISTSPIVNTTNLAHDLLNGSPEKFVTAATSYQQEILCQFPVVKDFNELLGDAFEKELQARYCEAHDGYHVYHKSQSPTKTIAEQLHSQVSQSNVENPEAFHTSIKRLGFIKAFHEDKETAAQLRSSYGKTTEGQAYLEARNLGFNKPKDAALTRMIEERRKHLSGGSEPRLPAEKLTDEQALEFWECGRKTPYSTPEEALERFQAHQTAEGTAYKCEQCQQYHAAHLRTSPPSSTNRKIKAAKMYWNRKPEKANLYAFRKGLI